MNTLKYAAALRFGAEKLINNPQALWWYEAVTPDQQIWNWLIKISELPNAVIPLDFMTNSEAALCFLLLAEALEAGDLP